MRTNAAEILGMLDAGLDALASIEDDDLADPAVMALAFQVDEQLVRLRTLRDRLVATALSAPPMARAA